MASDYSIALDQMRLTRHQGPLRVVWRDLLAIQKTMPRWTCGRTVGLSGPLHGPLCVLSHVSCVSWWAFLNAAETYETVHLESGMRYHSNHSIL
jgi:hypothetical protein